ncbi:DUF4019 domain-containing protein [Ramlibacter algicola]|uniref:DUF4019 domain-containing protein n=1 Tax=Ramlibacter algicola TaxID=2795217 RepID=A0A934UTL0_9BURK|nr:DUF4019 domain-containing protein [Ramlibacter algicola]MBK0394868.1 DUF4019 domain-containing protein [Ramlibacter algicola]
MHLIRFLVLVLLAGAAMANPLNGEVPIVLAPVNADKDWMPSAEQVRHVVEQSRRYFAARDAGRFDAAFRQYAPTQKAQVSFDGWRKGVQEFNQRAGGVRSRKLLRITWYKDPPQARPGVYAAVDFASTTAKLALHCGYLVWREQDDGKLGIVREEDNVLDPPSLAQVPVEKVRALKKAMHCT